MQINMSKIHSLVMERNDLRQKVVARFGHADYLDNYNMLMPRIRAIGAELARMHFKFFGEDI